MPKDKDIIIVVYDNKSGLPAFTCDTISQACDFIECSTQALYKALHLTGSMNVKGFTVDLVDVKGV